MKLNGLYFQSDQNDWRSAAGHQQAAELFLDFFVIYARISDKKFIGLEHMYKLLVSECDLIIESCYTLFASNSNRLIFLLLRFLVGLVVLLGAFALELSLIKLRLNLQRHLRIRVRVVLAGAALALIAAWLFLRLQT